MLSEPLPNSGAMVGPAVQPVRWKRLLILLLAVSGGLVALSLFLRRGLTYVSEEANLPTWWTVSLLVVASGLHVAVAMVVRRSGERGAAAWWLLATLLAMLSLDELAGLHERLQEWGLALLDNGFVFAWVVVGVPIAIGVVAFTLVAARHLPYCSAVLSVGGIGLFIGSAVGLEAVGGLLLGDNQSGQGDDVGYVLVMHLEEFGEMAGAALAACAPLAALRLGLIDTALGVSVATRHFPARLTIPRRS